jgi:hypothetical protein
VELTRDEGPPDTVLPQLVAHLPADGTAEAALWPFTRALAVRVGGTAAPSGAVMPFDVPAHAAALDFVYGINPERWLNLVDGPFVFRITVDGTPTFEASLDPARDLGDRRWARGSIDLTAWAGRTVRLGFSVSGPVSLVGDADLAGWARFLVRPSPDEASRGDR